MAGATGIAVGGLSAAITAVQIYTSLDPSGAAGGAQAPLLVALDAAAAAPEVVLLLPLTLAFFAAVAFVHVHALNRRVPEIVTFVLNVSVGLLVACLVSFPGAVDGGPAEVQAPSLGVMAFHALLPSAIFTFFLSLALIYAQVRAAATAAGAGAGGPIRADVAVALITKMTLGATIVSCMAIVLACCAM